jgi:outer membrane protein W
MIPIWVDAGFRFNPNLYVGAFFQYGIGFVNKDKNPQCEQISCSVSDIAFGANVHYHISPAASFDPWVGAGVGYEMLGLKSSGTVNTGLGQLQLDVSQTIKGLQFVTLQAGGDFKVTPDFAVGPFVNFAMGQYTGYSASSGGQEVSGDLNDTGLHEWLTIGVRGQYNL